MAEKAPRRKFNGEDYRLVGVYFNGLRASEYANKLRRSGKRARVTSGYGRAGEKFAVWQK